MVARTAACGPYLERMARVLYFDCFSGISGDMILGAFLDARPAVRRFEARAGQSGDAGIRDHRATCASGGRDRPPDSPWPSTATRITTIRTATTMRMGRSTTIRMTTATRTTTNMAKAMGHSHTLGDNGHTHRTLPEIFGLIDQSALSTSGRNRAKELFHRLAEAEAAIHQTPIDQVHLHEVGALDSIIDIVGAVFALEWAGADRMVCSPLNVGGGMVESAHGLFPVPAPATLKLLGDAPVYSGAVQKELVTPTGALIATSYASSFGPIPPLTIERVGYGAGTRDNPRDAECAQDPDRRGGGSTAGRSGRRHRMRDRRHEPAALRIRHGPLVRSRARSKSFMCRCR